MNQQVDAKSKKNSRPRPLELFGIGGGDNGVIMMMIGKKLEKQFKCVNIIFLFISFSPYTAKLFGQEFWKLFSGIL